MTCRCTNLTLKYGLGLLAVFILTSLHAGEPVEITILQTTDLHGYLTESDTLKEGGGGFLRLATLIERQRERSTHGNILTIDCGDTLFGSLEALPSRGRLPLRMLRAMDYDVWVPGNHELDLGAAELSEICREVSAQDFILCGNLILKTTTKREQRFRGWKMFTYSGLDIVVVGMTASYTENWFWGQKRQSFSAQPALDAIGGMMGEIRRLRPHLIVLAIHQGWLPDDPRQVNEVKAIVEAFPEIDLVLGGHTHWGHAGRRLGVKSWYVQSGKHADCLAVVRIVVDAKERKVISMESELLPAGPEIPPHPGLQRQFAKQLEEVKAFSVRQVGTLATPLQAGGAPGVDSGTSELLSHVIAQAAQARVVIHGKLSRRDFAAGPLTEKDLFDLVPYENDIGTLSLAPGQLKAVVEEQLANRKSYVANGLWGIQAVCLDGKVLRLLWPDGQEFSTGRTRVAFNSYALAGGGGRFPLLQKLADDPECQPQNTGLTTRDIVRDYFKRTSPVSLVPRPWILEKPSSDTHSEP